MRFKSKKKYLGKKYFSCFPHFLQHPYKYLNINNNNILILGVAKLLLCLSEK